MSAGPNTIRIMTVDDHPLLRQGIAVLLGGQPDMELVAEASDGQEAIAQFRRHRPDVTLMDLQMPNVNGTEAISRIRSEFPDAKILVFSTYAGDVQVLHAMKAGGPCRAQANTARNRGGTSRPRCRRPADISRN
jgi:DNA-binding NarL/FixJ family response regulator